MASICNLFHRLKLKKKTFDYYLLHSYFGACVKVFCGIAYERTYIQNVFELVMYSMRSSPSDPS